MTKTPETIWAAEMAVRLSEMQAERDAAIARAEEADAATRKWQSIETAPKDGERVLLHSPSTHTYSGIVGIWDILDERWAEWDSWHPCYPTHWMPLPPPPETP